MTTRNFEVHQGGRLAAAPAANQHARTREIVFRQAELDPKLKAIARRNGLDEKDILPLVMEECALRERDQYNAGYRAGQRSYWTPTTPAMAKRAA